MTAGRVAGRGPQLRGSFRPSPAVAACFVAAALFAAGTMGLAQSARPDAGADSQSCACDHRSAGNGVARATLQAAVAAADAGHYEQANSVLASALERCPDHPELLGGLAGLRLRQGRLEEAEALAARVVRIQPGTDYGWELLAAIRYLRDDARGALRAWSRVRPPVVRQVAIRVHGPGGERTPDGGPDATSVTGLAPGRPLTLADLVRGSRRLEALPAATRARLGYRALSGGEADVEGSVLLGDRNPFTALDLAAHAVRLLARSVHIVSADPLGRFERWELSGVMEGKLRRVALAVDHPAPVGFGVWRWEVDHEVGRYGPAGHDGVAREERTGAEWSHVDWVAASLRRTVRGRIDIRPARGTFAGVGAGWTLLPVTARSSIGAEGTGWVRVGGAAAGAGEPRAPAAFGRLEVRASIHPPAPPPAGAPSGVHAHVGGVAVSPRIPADLMPRIGAGGNTAVLMRARSDLDGEGVVRPIFPGMAWAHGGVEVLRPVVSVGPVGVGLAAFADAVQVLARDRTSPEPASRRGAVHLGAGLRARIPGINGWLRVDGGIDPVHGGSAFSAAWFHEHRLSGFATR